MRVQLGTRQVSNTLIFLPVFIQLYLQRRLREMSPALGSQNRGHRNTNRQPVAGRPGHRIKYGLMDGTVEGSSYATPSATRRFCSGCRKWCTV